jgi:hypothetical protein
MSVPGIWSQVKRAPKANRKRKTFEVAGPAVEGAMPMDERARQLFSYFKSYNYKVKETGEVIVFEGIYAADRGQAAAVTFYTFIGAARGSPGRRSSFVDALSLPFDHTFCCSSLAPSCAC